MTVRHNTASAIVLDSRDRVLLVHHRKSGLWLYPGGHVDPNEDPAEAAVREAREETGIDVDIVGKPSFEHSAVRSIVPPFAIIEMEVIDSRDGQHRHIDFVYVCRAQPGALTPQVEEVAGVEWVAVDAVADLNVPLELPALVAAGARWAATFGALANAN
ncbi:NUDIX hydrolase [Micromonospora sp. NBC_01796]|uniref:NUDIX hydrolase n=1 Tax=Micromonospora sp. NBC_01796 TaxID=2975987 RepID=UPI002DD930EA|nr:NUDIX domain-containing protein [Micromonospora sp. NBC_01796]WSA86456.1 NUDIX domain-containing protein [Micromonospora sp. NBC_01796]